MQKYYSVDRRDRYAEGKLMKLEPNPPLNGNEVHAHILRMYPDGFSPHGIQYFRNVPSPNWTQQDHQSALLDYFLEACRKGHYPDKPCRFQSLFACESLEDAQQFRAQKGKPTDPIFELEPQGSVHRGDMLVYSIAPTLAGVDRLLHLYWQGMTLENPVHKPAWEHVLALPVMVGQRVA